MHAAKLVIGPKERLAATLATRCLTSVLASSSQPMQAPAWGSHAAADRDPTPKGKRVIFNQSTSGNGRPGTCRSPSVE